MLLKPRSLAFCFLANNRRRSWSKAPSETRRDLLKERRGGEEDGDCFGTDWSLSEATRGVEQSAKIFFSLIKVWGGELANMVPYRDKSVAVRQGEGAMLLAEESRIMRLC